MGLFQGTFQLSNFSFQVQVTEPLWKTQNVLGKFQESLFVSNENTFSQLVNHTILHDYGFKEEIYRSWH